MSQQPVEYGFKQIVENELSVVNVLQKVSEEILWRHYTDNSFQLNKPFSAPYRVDRDPSFSLKIDYRGRIMYSDFGKGLYGDIFNYLQMIYSESFVDSLKRINYDFKLGLGDLNYIPQSAKQITKSDTRNFQNFTKSFEKDKSRSIKIQIIPKAYQKEDLEYWEGYGITKTTLDFYKVYCIRKLFLDGVVRYDYTGSANPCYAYHFTKSDHVKCYFPFQKAQRFLSNINNFEDIQGYYQCDVKNLNKKLLILTKSMKDCMCLRELGFEAMAINGEGHRFNEDFIRHIKKYYPYIVSIYDMDETGVKGAKYLWKEYGIRPYFIPRIYRSKECKDIADLRKNYGHAKTMEFLNQIISIVKN